MGRERERAGDEFEARPARAGHGRRFFRGVVGGLAAVLLAGAAVVGVYLAGLAHSYDTKTQKIENAFPEPAVRPAKPALPNGGAAMNILVLGSDARPAALDAAEQAGASDQRSDSMMLVHVPADRRNIYIMSIMRDTWVQIPGHGEAKINAAMAYGGIPLVVQTVEGILDVPVDHVAILDFEGFKSMTDALGGVEVDVPIAFSATGFDFAAGTQLLSGDKALVFVRERYAFADGDYQRVRNQQLFLKAVMGKLLTAETLSNPARISTIVDGVSPFLTVDRSLDSVAVGRLVIELRNVRSADMESFTLPNSGTGWSLDGQSIVVPDQAAIDAVGAALKADTLGQYLAAAGQDA
ncbi:LCP family protein [Arthrobacter sp. CJ23]|uniref:LCP family protein n=1 Tax=Arthrobacter sp. CJ23 TaxID=2972479 RepID=UPI00215BD301|nr:LCP family protein [Arthrobacter sp. CJ23]UVJ38130.1 LCP family protein [Arthrobacter sp. CJ23]